MSGSVEAIPPTAVRSRSTRARRAARAAKAGRVKPAVDLLNAGVSVAEAVLRERLTRGPEMAPQVFETSRFTPGNGMAPNGSDPQDLGARPPSQTFHSPHRGMLRTNDTRSACVGSAVENRPEMARQSVEKTGFAPGNGMAPTDHRHRERSEAIQGIVGRSTFSWIATPPKPVERRASFDALWRLAMTRPSFRTNGRTCKVAVFGA